MAEAERTYGPLSSYPPPLKHVIQLSCKKYLPLPGEHSYHQRWGMGGQESCTRRPCSTHPYLPRYSFTFLSCPFFKNTVFLCLKGINASCSGHFFESSFSFEGFHVYVKMQPNVDAFPLFNLSRQFNFQNPAWSPMRFQENFFFPYKWICQLVQS